MTLSELVQKASSKENFTTLAQYIDFSRELIDFSAAGVQAEIVCQNEPQFRFWQFPEEGHFNISRPLNSELMYSADHAEVISGSFLPTLEGCRDIPADDQVSRSILCRSIYSIQQSIGIALDALPAGESNRARKVCGDLFERLIQLLLLHLNVDCVGGTIKLPVLVDGQELFKMQYQHDLVIKSQGQIKAIGSIKTSSKDRIDKIFVDKFLFNRITGVNTPHLAIFLNDVQRGKKVDHSYKVSTTFLPGHFKGYTIKLNPLDGVYYCDIRPSMISDALLAQHIRTIDHFFCTDLWTMLEIAPAIEAEVGPPQE